VSREIAPGVMLRAGILAEAGVDRDAGYIASSWAESSGSQLHDMTGAKPREWKELLRTRLAQDMRRHRLAVACDVDDQDRIYGWACGSPGVLAYVYVRDTRRRQGIGRALVLEVCGGTPKRCLWLTPSVQVLALQHHVEWRP
jgi:hypothetical protein